MKKAAEDREGWWLVVKSMADLVASGYDELELTEPYVRSELASKGFEETEILEAVTWVEKQ